MSDSVRPHRWQPTRLPCPRDSPGKNTGVGCHFLLQCMKGKNESEVTQSCPTLSDPMDCSPPGSSVHGIFQAKVLEWGAIAFSLMVWVACKMPYGKWLLCIFFPCWLFKVKDIILIQRKNAHNLKHENNKNMKIIKLNLSYYDTGKLHNSLAGPLMSKPFPMILGNSQSSCPPSLSTSRSYAHILCSCVISCDTQFFGCFHTHKNILILMTSWVWLILAQLISSFSQTPVTFPSPLSVSLSLFLLFLWD